MLPKQLTKAPIQLLVLFGTLALFLLTNAFFGSPNSPFNFIPVLLAIVIVIEIFAFVSLEVKEGAQKHGWKHEVVDTIIALVVAVVIWFGASFLLNTSSPVSGVVSCSMLPNLERGDFILVQGAPVQAYEISMTQDELDSLNDRAMIRYDNKNISMDGSIFSYCVYHSTDALCDVFKSSPEKITEEKGAFTYRYETCPISYQDGDTASMPCLKSVTFKGQEYLTNFSNDIIVYAPPTSDLYAYIGDIVHRAMFKIDVNGENYYLTRGDNNPVLDLQVYDYGSGFTNHPVPEEYLRGKVIGRVPWLGYFKLFISGYLQEDPQCRMQLEYTHVS